MTTRYRVEYALKSHRRDQLIEWIKGLLAVPFVLHSQPTAVFEPQRGTTDQMATIAHRRYGEIMRDVEELINDHIAHQQAGTHERSKLKMLVPSVGMFFTPLYLHDAFVYQDNRRFISSRRFVPPSFNDIRLILNTSQVMSLTRGGPIELITFDGDVTLYDDGESLTEDNPVIPRILALMTKGTKIGIVTAAGYTDARRYYERLHGLLDAIYASNLPSTYKQNLIILGGESNYLFKFSEGEPDRLKFVPRKEWLLDDMVAWQDADITELLDVAEIALKDCITTMRLEAQILRKERAVGIIPLPGKKLFREQLEETVLVAQKILEISPVGRRLPFCAFNGGNDVFVDIGDKSWGVRACQHFFACVPTPISAIPIHGRSASVDAAVIPNPDPTSIAGAKTLHVGDQFLSAGANDFKARLACTTAWIANPAETVALLDEMCELDEALSRKIK
ncbi:IMP-specific 5'-nucleotidase-like protein 1 [Aulographum hederae CBS 113979]|uniref:IMP-specific 5'-nucleotidase 1 n=1 Tax=Aulographum hederae CBS 113979 TaxID=1176131 RepID=A0A6G1H203_9PEZI|nr:IMP-specific 5'-nucleotidase-like protein 1 [Aulographum hederae CBS 113979]